MSKTAVLLVNLGTPESPQVANVRSYLSEFLNDPYVIDLPWLTRKILVNCIIVPFRAPKSAKAYEKLWKIGDGHSPLMTYSISLANKLENMLAAKGQGVYLAMRYGTPTISSAVAKMQEDYVDKIILLPLYPQYALASTETVIQELSSSLTKLNYSPKVSVIRNFYNDEGYIESIANRAANFDLNSYDHILFSYHGLPTRQIEKTHSIPCNGECILNDVPENRNCYKAQCYATTRLLVSRLGVTEHNYTVCFQSRLNKNWITPFSDQILVDLANKGAKRVLVFSPAFVADCLETVIEIGEEYQEIFQENGGERVDFVPSLNDGDDWVQAVSELVKNVQ